MISCLILSAGESTRFGSPKALAIINSKPCIYILQEKILQTTADEIIIVLGHEQERIKSYVFNHKKVRVVYNKNYKFGQTSSVQAGLREISSASSGFMLIPVDCPFIQTATMEALIQSFNLENNVLIPTFQGKRGHPPIFSKSLKYEILNLPANQGLNALLKTHPIKTIEINDPGITSSFNTPKELQALQ